MSETNIYRKQTFMKEWIEVIFYFAELEIRTNKTQPEEQKMTEGFNPALYGMKQTYWQLSNTDEWYLGVILNFKEIKIAIKWLQHRPTSLNSDENYCPPASLM